jgi:hypothetical protein
MRRFVLLPVVVLVALAAPAAASAAPPDVDFTATPSLPATGDAVTFAATVDDEGVDVTLLSWDFNGDGIPELSGPAAAMRTVSWTFRTTGVHQVTLTARNLLAEMGSINKPLTVVDPSPVTEPQPPGSSAAGAAPGPTFSVPASAVAGATAQGTVRLRLMAPFPIVRLQGRVVRGGAAIRRLTVSAPRGARVRVTCSGGGCFTDRATLVKIARKTQILRFHGMERRLKPGAVIRIYVGRDGRIGKYTRFVIRKDAVPAREDRCLITLSRSPSACPST